jgi:hypothetical protein
VRACTAVCALALAACAARPWTQPPAREPAGAAVADDDADVPLHEWHAQLESLLASHVDGRTGRVDYTALSRQWLTVQPLLKIVAEPRAFPTDRHRFAFLINAYNLLVLAEVTEHWPLESPRQIDGFFERPAHRVLGRRVSLTRLRDQIRRFRDPRVHMALCDAAAGSPPLRAEPYSAERLDEQFDDQAQRFLGDPILNAALSDMALISPIFDTYAEDFTVEPYTAVVVFLRTHATPASPLGRLMARTAHPRIEFQEFNWVINGR